jgi:NAD(P)-dependent dehydrogenase (short-subunit alcohol dehydrogenase family)
MASRASSEIADGSGTVVVTGGTGALGREVVRRFLDRGDRVVVPWIVKAEREALAGEFRDALSGALLELIEADVTDAAGADEVARTAAEARVLVNGVGGFAGGTTVDETALEVWDQMYRINVRSAVAMSRALLPGMRSRRQGVIVNVASQAARERPAGLAAYSASKAAILVLTETLQKEVADDGIRVHAVVPTTIDTPANRAAMPDADFASWTAPSEIAKVIGWLAGADAETVRAGLVPV